MSSVDRPGAIRRLSKARLPLLSKDDRSERLSCLGSESGWSFEYFTADQSWVALAAQIPNHPSEDTRFDPVLLEQIASDYRYATNRFLAAELKRLTDTDATVTGTFKPACSCPCCGLETLEDIGAYDICPVCWWEDDGADTKTYLDPPPPMEVDDLFADGPHDERMQESLHMLGMGPNKVGLLTARINFLIHGICEPARTDLREHQDPPEKYAIGRRFEWDTDQRVLSEPATGWSSKIKCSN